MINVIFAINIGVSLSSGYRSTIYQEPEWDESNKLIEWINKPESIELLQTGNFHSLTNNSNKNEFNSLQIKKMKLNNINEINKWKQNQIELNLNIEKPVLFKINANIVFFKKDFDKPPFYEGFKTYHHELANVIGAGMLSVLAHKNLFLFLLACPKCNKKVELADGAQLHCSRCNEIVPRPSKR